MPQTTLMLEEYLDDCVCGHPHHCHGLYANNGGVCLASPDQQGTDGCQRYVTLAELIRCIETT